VILSSLDSYLERRFLILFDPRPSKSITNSIFKISSFLFSISLKSLFTITYFQF
jgi:hypothetical protein